MPKAAESLGLSSPIASLARILRMRDTVSPKNRGCGKASAPPSAIDVNRRIIRTVALAPLVLAATASAWAATLAPIGLLPGGNYRLGRALSGDGSTVAGYGNSSSYVLEGFRWTAEEGAQGLGVVPGGTYHVSFARGISTNGLAIVGALDEGIPPAGIATSGHEAFRWTPDGMIGLGFLNGGGRSEANGVSADGSVVVGFSYSSAHPRGEAFRWAAGEGMVGLGSIPGSNSSFANAVSADGSTVVGYAYSNGEQAFRWTQSEGMVGLGFLPGGGRTRAIAVSADGSVVVGVDIMASQAFRWTASGGMAGLGVLPGKSNSSASAVSADGSVIVGVSGGGGDDAFIWTADGGMQSLLDVLVAGGATDLIGRRIHSVPAISADGRYVLIYTSAEGHPVEYVAQLVPLPPTSLLLITAFAGLAARRRSRTKSRRSGGGIEHAS